MAVLVACKFGKANLPGLICGPVGAPAVICIQEWWGITDNIRAQALRLSEGGFRVLVPDIYKGAVGVDMEEAHHLMSNLDFPNAVVEIGEAAAFLKAEGSSKVGIIGFCMGGALAVGSLAAHADITCGAPFYGVNFGLFQPEQLANKPVSGHFGSADAMAGFSDAPTAAKLAEMLKGNAQSQIYMYEGAGHAFMNETPQPYASFEARTAAMGMPAFDKATADVAWDRVIGFFGEHLK
ncbi:dienelactone hydrolase [Pelagophyceae sp. CCMP2097]|nr:dienelactone hydrolase [Pelagophyceae sp. CCMP2097]|mmetsp:Transcript_21045/g.71275  ORF Transcript_21045/g.71275 Transcript_21045/m.71275 type:complete len:237 (-) Transcript_21045:118-828(-)